MIKAEDLLQQRVVLDEIYQVWECQRMESDQSGGQVIFTGVVGPICGACGGASKDFIVRFRKDTLGGGFKAKEKVLLAIQDQLDE